MGQRYTHRYSLLCDCLEYENKDDYCSKEDIDRKEAGVKLRRTDVLFTVHMSWLILFTTSLPFFALFLCLAAGLHLHYEKLMNNTWCPQVSDIFMLIDTVKWLASNQGQQKHPLASN